MIEALLLSSWISIILDTMFLPFITLKDPIIMDIFNARRDWCPNYWKRSIEFERSNTGDKTYKILSWIVFSNCFGEERGKWWLRGLLLRIRVALAVSSVPFLPTKNGNVIRYSSSLSRRIIASRFAALCHANILQRN